MSNRRNRHLPEVAAFMADAPLYVPKRIVTVEVERPTYPNVFPAFISRRCDRCELTTRWDRTYPVLATSGLVSDEGFQQAAFQCRNCREGGFFVWFYFRLDSGALVYEKVGQCPKFEIDPPAVLKKALSPERLDLYKRGKTLRHHGYGLGALIYFRRLVEDTTNEMLDLLAGALREIEGDTALVARVLEAKTARAFEDKVHVAADAIPAHLRPGGVNPFHVIYDEVSKGIHNLGDNECCEIVDKLDAALTFVFKELKTHVEERKAYVENLKKLTSPDK